MLEENVVTDLPKIDLKSNFYVLPYTVNYGSLENSVMSENFIFAHHGKLGVTERKIDDFSRFLP